MLRAEHEFFSYRPVRMTSDRSGPGRHHFCNWHFELRRLDKCRVHVNQEPEIVERSIPHRSSIMKRLCLVVVGVALLLTAGCQSHNSGSTAPSTNPEKPRKLVVKVPHEKSIKLNGAAEIDVNVT